MRNNGSGVGRDRALLGAFASQRLTSHTLDTTVFVIVVSTCVAVGLFLQATTFLNHDIAWILYSTESLINGGVFGKDIIAANPPLIWYLSFPVVLISNLFSLPEAAVFSSHRWVDNDRLRILDCELIKSHDRRPNPGANLRPLR